MSDSSLVCPRCRLSLDPDSYEGAPVHRCAGCWGYWVSASSLGTILTAQEEVFSKAERQQAMDRVAEDPSSEEPLACLACGRSMIKRVVLGSVLVDACPGHGAWLDTGEIKSLQVLAEIDDAVRRWLLEKMGC